MLYHQVSGQARHKSGELFRLAHVAAPNLCQRNAKDLLRQILGDRRIAYLAPDDDSHAAAVAFDQLGLSQLVACQNAGYEIGLNFDISCDHRSLRVSLVNRPAWNALRIRTFGDGSSTRERSFN